LWKEFLGPDDAGSSANNAILNPAPSSDTPENCHLSHVSKDSTKAVDCKPTEILEFCGEQIWYIVIFAHIFCSWFDNHVEYFSVSASTTGIDEKEHVSNSKETIQNPAIPYKATYLFRFYFDLYMFLLFSEKSTTPSGLSGILSLIGNKRKINTLVMINILNAYIIKPMFQEKSKLDWDNFKRKAKLEEELTQFNRGKDG